MSAPAVNGMRLREPDPRVVEELERIIAPERVLSRPIDRLGRSADASIYRLIPEAIVRPRGLAEVRDLFTWARCRGRHLTFRAAGTSLCGQAVTDGVLVELAPYFRSARVLDAGARIWTEPGVVGGHLNRMLARHGRRIGPDPASIDAAMIGGIVANNSSGMCCGVAQNSYHTLDSAVLLLTDGTAVDTREPDADAQLRRARPALHAELVALRDEIRADARLAGRIRKKFATKNTSGYSLNAFLDHEDPAQILAHLMVGSEGTLGFVAELTLRTLPEPPARATALVFLRELEDAGRAVAPLAAAGADALEILDAASLRAIAAEHPLPFEVEARHAGLLVELRRRDLGTLSGAISDVEAILGRHALVVRPRFTTGAAERAALWQLRKGLAARTGALRPTGTAFMSEDIAFPVERLAEAIRDCQALFGRHGMPDTAIFGHAKDGNLHFVMAEDVRSPEAIERYAQFSHDLVELVVGKYDGAIKAEHGSGAQHGAVRQARVGRARLRRDAAREAPAGSRLGAEPRRGAEPEPARPPREPEALPDDLAARGPLHRVRLLRAALPLARPHADAAAADRGDARAGAARRFGRPRGRRLPGLGRGRLRVRRGRHLRGGLDVRVGLPGEDRHRRADEGAQGARPLRGRALARGARRQTLRRRRERRARRAGRRRPAAVRWLGARAVELAAGSAGALLPALPRLPSSLPLPRPAPRLWSGDSPTRETAVRRSVVYFPSCLTRIVGPLPGENGLPPSRTMREVLAWAGFSVRVPDGVSGLCCGMAFSSKGYAEAARSAARSTAEALWRATSGGRLPVVTDASPCAGTLAEAVAQVLRETGREIQSYDFPVFWAREVLPSLGDPPRRAGTAILHPTCTLVKAGGLADLLAVARAHADSVEVPLAAECCGFAGDKGFLVPELTESATAAEAAEVRGLLEREPNAGCYSTCRTCEIGMSRAVGRAFRPLLALVHEAIARA